MRVARLLLLLALAAAGPLAAETGRSVAGTDRARVLPPAGAVVEPYRNAGYELRFAEGGVEVSVDLAPLASPEPFSAPAVARRGLIAVLARRTAAGASTRYEAVTRVLSWIREHVRYELDRDQPQDPEAVLERGSAYCTGIAKLAVAMRSVGFVSKLFAEGIEEIERGQVEAVAATGATRGQLLVFGVLPQVRPVLAGVWPLTSYKQALRLNNEVPGIVIPDPVLKELEAAGTAARERGFALARTMLDWARTELAGAYLIPPFKRYEEILELFS